MNITSKKSFQEARKKGPILVDLYTTWCGPCKTQAEILAENEEKLKDQFPKLDIHKIDIECDKFFDKLANALGIRSIPQLILFNGQDYKMKPGVKRIGDIEAFLKEHLK